MNGKDVVYVDIDDEITAIVDKLRGSSQRIVAMVLPKRAVVLQSSINMKLLKRTADDAKKHVVLITTESGLMPLAAAAGLHVAPTLQSKPAIPALPDGSVSYGPLDDAATSEQPEEADFDPFAKGATPIGQLSGSAVPPAAPVINGDEPETIELDDEPADKTDVNTAAPVAAAAAASAATVNKKLKVPDFHKFRTGLIVALLILVVGGVAFAFADTSLARAVITIQTDSSTVTTNANITLDPSVTAVDTANKVLPAKIVSKQQTSSQQVPATGQQNQGQKATGQLTVTNCSSSSVTIPAGTGFSANNLTYISQSDITVPKSTYSLNVNGTFSCNNDGTQTVNVVAQNPGAQYNLTASSSSPRDYAIAGSPSKVTATDTQGMSGGTDNIVKVVSQADIDAAKQKITAQDSGSVSAALKQMLQSQGYMAVTASLHGNAPSITSSAQVGDQADTVTVTQTTTYTMYGVRQSDLKQFIDSNVKTQIDPTKQQILSSGTAAATFQVGAPVSSGPLPVSVSATSLAGPDLNQTAIKQAAAGQKTGDVQSMLKSDPGVVSVTIKYSPFWVSSVPKNPSQISIVIQKSAPPGQKP